MKPELETIGEAEMMTNKINIKALRETITKSANGEVFDALFGGDVSRIKTTNETKQIEMAVRSVVNTLSFFLNGDPEGVAEVFKTSALAKVASDPSGVIVNTCKALKNGYADAAKFYGDYEIVQPQSVPASGKVFLGISHVEDWLNEHGVSVRFNLMTQAIEITGYKERELQAGGLLNTLPAVIYDDYANCYKGVSQDIVLSYIRVIAEGHSYHPVLELLAKTEWDGTSRFSDFFELLHINDDDPQHQFSQKLIKKWMRQSIALLHNGENGETFGGEGVLTLSGAQGIGKTTLLRCMAIDRAFFREGQRLDDRDKDTARRCITTWIAELGELDCTLKSDLGYLKAFITADIDSYRLPYGRADITMPRRASLAASVNGDTFLVDPTGNRRFWTVELEEIDINGVMAFDFLQLWKEVEVGMHGWLQSFRLDSQEQKLLAERNNRVEKGIKGEAEVRDILASGGHCTWATPTMMKKWYDVLKPYTAEAIGKVLNKLDVKSKKMRVNGTPCKVYYVPEELKKPSEDGEGFETDEIPF